MNEFVYMFNLLQLIISQILQEKMSHNTCKNFVPDFAVRRIDLQRHLVHDFKNQLQSQSQMLTAFWTPLNRHVRISFVLYVLSPLVH